MKNSPLFTIGDLSQVGIVRKSGRTFDTMQENTSRTGPPEFAKSPNRWSLYLKSISIDENFEALSIDENEIYFISIAWDYSGLPPIIYPPKDANISEFTIPLQPGNVRKFVGDGICIWPPRIVTGSLNIIITIFESDKDVRQLGAKLTKIHSVVKDTQLTSLITSIPNPTMIIAGTVANLAKELIGAIGRVLEENGDDYVNALLGSYATDKPQTSRVEAYTSKGIGIELEFVVS